LKRFFSKILLRLNILFGVLLLLTYVSVFISPENFWPAAFLGLLYPFLCITNIAFVILWVVKRKRAFLISLVIVAAGWWLMIRYVQINLPFSKKPVVTSNTKTLKILSYNVRLFNYYKWSRFADATSDIFAYINQEAPDIICLQEFYTREKGMLTQQNIQAVLKGTKYSHIKYIAHRNHVSNYGIATFSAYPIIGQGEILYGKTFNLSIFTDVKVGNDTFRIYNNHLQSIRFSKPDYDVMDTITYDQKELKGLIGITQRLKKAFILRAKQAEYIAAHIKSSRYPVIVCGDFNDSPISYTYQTISSKLKDAFVEAGSGMGKSYFGVFPSYRIDYVLHSKKFSVLEFNSPKFDFSDHFPIVCKLYKK
jgi:endonuclease/exonuclease/phosphatase family metal-dependent hydrolase